MEVIMAFQGKEFTHEMKQLIVNLKQHFDEEKKAGRTVSTRNAAGRVAIGLGVGEATVKRIMAVDKQGKGVVFEEKERGKPPYLLSLNLQPIIREFIRQKNLNGQKIRADQILEYLSQKHSVEIPMSTFLRSLGRLGFTYGIGKRRTALKEQDYVVLARRRYLRKKIANRNNDGSLKRDEVYLDETYINKNHSDQFTWYLEEDGPWVNKPSGKGPRVIVVNAITANGWVNNAQLIFDANRRTGDYHGQMNWDNFSKWFETQLLPNIKANSIIILDNARYHNVFSESAFPVPTTRKEALCDWLEKNDIPWTTDMLKPELYDLCKRLAPVPEYKLDQIAKAAGHSILRTPQYHPELQPIETCWGVVKNYMAAHCDFTMKNFREQLPLGFAKVTPRTCKSLIAKVVKQEEKYWAEDSKLYEEIEEGDDTLW
jgi:transposase